VSREAAKPSSGADGSAEAMSTLEHRGDSRAY
jgi:hypothetical protein